LAPFTSIKAISHFSLLKGGIVLVGDNHRAVLRLRQDTIR
jgi:hypothetical protein